MLVISSGSICRLLCLKRGLFSLTPRMISIIGASLKRAPQLGVELAFCHDIYILNFFFLRFEVSLSLHPSFLLSLPRYLNRSDLAMSHSSNGYRPWNSYIYFTELPTSVKGKCNHCDYHVLFCFVFFCSEFEFLWGRCVGGGGGAKNNFQLH